MNLQKEFERQLQNLLQKGYHRIAGRTELEFSMQAASLSERVADIECPKADIEAGKLPFAIVVSSELVPTETALSLIDFHGQSGVEKLVPKSPEDFTHIENLNVPDSPLYLIADIDRGRETLNVTPHEALERIEQASRSPLTIDEGIAVLTHFPEFLMKNNCFSLLGSRCGDKRVPALWISEKRPKLGWCWEGNPHTWLGSASCATRVGG